MKRIIFFYLLVIFFTGVFCKPEIKRSTDTSLIAVINSQKSTDIFSVSYSPNIFSFPPNVPITTIAPIVMGGTILTCNISSTLPNGLSIDSSCKISGIPTTIQTETSYTIIASNGNIKATAVIRISIANTPLSVVYPGSPYNFTIGVGITPINPTVIGNITLFAINPALPIGLSFNTANGQISGTPTALSPITPYTVTASNSNNTTTGYFNLSVMEAPPSALSYIGSPYNFMVNTAISPLIATVTGTATACYSTPTLPVGLSIDSTCKITGTPTTTQGSFSYTITATNSGGNTSTVINITVYNVAPSALAYSGNPFTFTQNTAISTIVPTVTGTVTNCTSTPPMPSGMSLNSTTCAISGTPSLNSTTTSYTITASNSVGNTIAVINITVVSPAPLGKRIFVTSSGYSPGSHFTTTITADMKCGIDPGKPIGAGTYKAMIVSSARTACISANCTTSGAAEHLDWIFTPNTTYYQADGLTVVATTDANALMPATFINIATPHAKYWTGLITDWTTSSMNCANWGNTGMSTCGGSSPNNASANFTDIWGSVTCSAPQQLLCVEQ